MIRTFEKPIMIRTFDEATKNALRRLLPFAPGSFITIGLDCFDFLPEAQRPVFRLRDLSAAQWYKVRAVGVTPVDLMVEILQDGVMGPWDNLIDSEFQEIPFTKEAIAKLPLRWIETLFYAAVRLCSPDKLEREVLESLLPSTSALSSSPADSAAVPPA